MNTAHISRHLLVAALALNLAGCAGMRPTASTTADAAQAAAAKTQLTDPKTGQRVSPDRPRADRRTRLGSTYTTTIYTREDLANTGEIDLGAALRKLDPRFY